MKSKPNYTVTNIWLPTTDYDFANLIKLLDPSLFDSILYKKSVCIVNQK